MVAYDMDVVPPQDSEKQPDSPAALYHGKRGDCLDRRIDDGDRKVIGKIIES